MTHTRSWQAVHSNLLHSHQQIWAEPLLPMPPSPTEWPTGPAQFLSSTSHWSSGGKIKHLLTTGYIGLLDSYLQYVICTFNTFSWGPTHRSLTDTNGGYHLGDLSFPHHSPRPSKPMILLFSLLAPSSLKLTSSTITSNKRVCRTYRWHMVCRPLGFYRFL
jgi:hypothetical protein